MNLVLRTNPKNVTFLTPRPESGRLYFLLMLKELTVGGRTPVFLVDTNGFKGFQFGDGKNGGALDDLYSDDAKLEFIIARKNRGPVAQPEINRIIRTLRKLPASPVQDRK